VKHLGSDLLRGTALAGVMALGAWFVARYGFGRLYVLGALLPALMVTMLLVAWLMHLKADGFFGKVSKAEPGDPAERSDPEQPFARFGEGVRERIGRPGRSSDSRDLQRALLWGAVELGLVSAALYHLAGIGANVLR
jgi:hypothetical protein